MPSEHYIRAKRISFAEANPSLRPCDRYYNNNFYRLSAGATLKPDSLDYVAGEYPILFLVEVVRGRLKIISIVTGALDEDELVR